MESGVRRGRENTHGIVGNQVYAGNLLEALHYHTQERTAEILGASSGEDLAQRRAIVTEVRLHRNCLPNSVVRLVHTLVRVGLAFERGDDRQCFGVTPVLSKPPG